ncbi:TRAF3-interacting protein 1, partial [Thoreauomyces humboldtii]
MSPKVKVEVPPATINHRPRRACTLKVKAQPLDINDDPSDIKPSPPASHVPPSRKKRKLSLPSSNDPTTSIKPDPSPSSTSSTSTLSTSTKIEALREWIQSLTRSTHPLGKTMDYMQEDVDSMNRELEHWRTEHGRYRTVLEDEM